MKRLFAVRLWFLVAIAAALAALVTNTLPASASAVANGSFEASGLSPWTTGGAGVDQVLGWNAKDGTKLVDLNALNAGSISQTFPTISGGVYTVSFWLSGNPQCGTGTTKTMTASAGSASITRSHTVPAGTPSNGSALTWTQETFNFTATGGTTALTFASSTSGTACGALIDLVVVTFVSAPPSLTAGGSVTYVEDSAPVIVAPGLTVGGTQNIDGAKASIGAGFNAAQDSLGIQGPLPAGISSSYNPANGVLTLTGSADPASYEAALRQVTFSNNSQNPAPTPRTVTFNIGSQLALTSNGHFYEFVPGSITWTSALAAAQTKTLFGMQGYLATITGATENAFIKDKLAGNGWLGGTDQAAESVWKWVSGPENGTTFCIGNFNCIPQGGAYKNWNGGEPNDAGGEDYLHMIGRSQAGPVGTWNDLPNGGGGFPYDVLGYVVEYGGMSGDPALVLSGDVTVNVQPVNDPPTANAGGPYNVNEGSSVTLNGSGSDVDSAGLGYEWDLDNNGTFETPGQNVTYNAVDGPASPIVNFRVCDSGTPLPSACATVSPSITVNNIAPDVQISGANTVYYTNWTSANVGGGTASGVITLPDASTINVSLSTSSGGFFGAQTSGGTNYWAANGGAPYISPQVPNPPPDSDIIQLQGGTATVYTVTFSQPIVDPIMAILSLGSGGNIITYDFDSPFTIVSQGVGFWGGCATCLTVLPGDVLRGQEGHGTIKFLGTYSSFSWTVPNPEAWHGFTFAVRSSQALAQTVIVNEGQTATNNGTWSDPGINDNVALSASIGSVVKNANGTWNWSLNTTDGPAQSQTVTITATDKDLASTSKTFPLVVNNVAPSGVVLNSPVISENGTATLTGSFTDPGILDTHTASVNWGDGSPATVVNLAANVLSFTVDHVYADDGASPGNGTASDNYTITITVTDKDNASDNETTAITVTNVAPANVLLNAPVINENGAATLAGSFTDPGIQDTHTVVISWGPGEGSTTLNLSAGVLTFSASHQYLDDNPTGTASDLYTVSVTVTDDDTGSGSASTSITVNNVAPVITANGSTISENGTATVSGTITDPGSQDTFTVVINWGEGAPQTFNYPAGTTSYSETHQYLDDNPTGTPSDVYTVNVTVTDDDTGSASASTTVTVNNVAPVIDTITPNQTLTFGSVVNVAATFSDVGSQDSWTYTINWGDGNVDGPLSAGGSIAGSHQYLVPIDPTITVCVVDDDTGSVCRTTQVTFISTTGKITAGLLRFGNNGRGGFNVQSSDGIGVKGELEYHVGSTNLHAHTMTHIAVSPDRTKGWFAGVLTDGRVFVAYVEDNGEPGGKSSSNPDVFKLWLNGIPVNGNGALTGGNVQIHK